MVYDRICLARIQLLALVFGELLAERAFAWAGTYNIIVNITIIMFNISIINITSVTSICIINIKSHHSGLINGFCHALCGDSAMSYANRKMPCGTIAGGCCNTEIANWL